MYEAIKNFNKQFSYQPEIKNESNLVKKSSFLVIGMGGSALTSELLKTHNPEIDITIRRDYDIPTISKKELDSKLIVLSSYSGNTEEVVDAFEKSTEQNLNIAVIATGGKLLSLAKEHNTPYIELPNTGIQPRLALGLSIKALMRIMGEDEELENISELSKILNPTDLEESGKTIALKLKNHVPVIYASNRNLSLAYNWKIKLNETGKIPAFFNVFPELNHNEMTGFDVAPSTRELGSKFFFIILKDVTDNPKILKRMEILEKLYRDRGLNVLVLELNEKNTWYKIFSTLVLADWVAYYTALEYSLESEQVPMVEEFKKLILK